MSAEADRSQIPYTLLFVPELHILTLIPDLFSSVIFSENEYSPEASAPYFSVCK